MNKRNNIVVLFLISFIFINWTNGQNNNGHVIYKKIKIDTTSANSIKDLRERTLFKKIDDDIKNLEYILEFNNVESTFKVIEGMDHETNRMIQFAIIAGGGNGLFYSNLNTREQILQKEAYGKQFLIFNNLDSINWKLTNESKIILGYKCYKAVSIKTIIGSKKVLKVNVIAWYAPKLPINFGPLGYAGLPGLIIEIEIGEFKYSMAKLEVNSKKKNIIKKPSKGKKMTLLEFQEYEKKLAGQSRDLMRK